MKRINILLCLVVLTGCNTLKGEKGEKGDSGPGTITMYSGSITSNNQIISIPAYTTDKGISVLVGDPTSYVEAPYFVPSLGINVYYTTGNYFLNLYNAQSALTTRYKIFVISGASSAGLRALSN